MSIVRGELTKIANCQYWFDAEGLKFSKKLSLSNAKKCIELVWHFPFIFAGMEMRELLKQYAQHGSVAGIYVRPGSRKPMNALRETVAIAGQGLEGDRYHSSGNRQVTLIQAEYLPVIASFLGIDHVDPSVLRRNIVVRGLNLLTLKAKKFRLGNAVLEYSGECHPCSRMEENLGHGGYNAMRGHGGILARILETGIVKVGDPVIPLTDESSTESTTND